MSALDRINNDDKESTMEWNGKGKNIVEVNALLSRNQSTPEINPIDCYRFRQNQRQNMKS